MIPWDPTDAVSRCGLLESAVRELIGITQRLSLSIQQVFERGITCELAHVDLKVQRHILSAVVKWHNRSTNLAQSCYQVLLLPLPKDVVEISMMEVE